MRNPDYESKDGSVKLYCGDCLDILPELGKVDAVVTDPPYGIGCEKHHSRKCGGKAVSVKKDYGFIGWDEKPTEKTLLDACRNKAPKQIIWGGNYFELPPQGGWLVWDKDNGSNPWADCELAWTNLDTSIRKFKYRWMGMLQEDMSNKEERVHPTQKPVALILWCLSFVPDSLIVFDPFMGSGTTGVACVRTRRKFIGIELEPKYFEIAVKRIEREFERTPLWKEEQAVMTQSQLFQE